MSAEKKRRLKTSEKTFIKNIGFVGFAIDGNVAEVDVKNGRLVRIRPLHYDAKYKPEELNPWKIKARGKVLEVPMKTLPPPLVLSYKKRVFSPNRIMYPLKRVDWDPSGDRHPEKRGESKFQRISWDEATDLITREIKRIHAQYGPYAILHQGDGHGESKTVHASHGCPALLLGLTGGFTKQTRNPDSWEGWFWGAKHMWGMDANVGLMYPRTNIIKDVSENTDMLLLWGFDSETTAWGFNGQMPSRIAYWWRELGIKCVYICPDLNYGAAIHADKWIPVLPNTDAALHLAISYVWMTEGTYDKDYIATHTFGFDKYQDYVMGKEDGIPKTPEWASPLCGVPEWTIKALARQWASQKTSIAHRCGGSMIRGPYAHEPARMEVCNLAMQGLGKPGVQQMSLDDGMPRSQANLNVAAARRSTRDNPKQIIAKPFIPDAILNPPVSWWGLPGSHEPVEDQFMKYTYPLEGCSEVHMIWTDAPCWTVCWNGGNKFIEALRSPKIEFILAQHQWLEDDCLYADIILPVNTKLEEEDICTDNFSGEFNSIFLEGKCIESLGDTKSDYEAVAEIAKKLGLYEEFTGHKTIAEWIKFGFDKSGAADMISWEEFQEKQYFVAPTAPDWEKDPVGLIKFYEDPEGNPLNTPSGKIEFYSQNLAKHFPDDTERPPVPHWIQEADSHSERRGCERAKKYPLLLVSNHPRWRCHAQHDDVSWLREIPTCKVRGPDGYLYEPVWIHPTDAATRGIAHGDIVKLYNERGIVLGGAYITERIIPGAVYQDHGARIDEIIPGWLDRGGSNNLIAPTNIVSKHATGMATSGFLVEVEKVSLAQLEEWMQQYPEAFARDYDPVCGLRFNAWIAEGT